MPNSVAANGLTVCHQGGGGQAISTVPDICKTPVGNAVVPLPYVIVSQANTLVQGSTTVKIDGGNMIGIDGCRFTMCSGDEPGTLGGVVSSIIKNESQFITTSFNVKVEGKGVGRLLDMMTMNRKNTIGNFLVEPVIVIDLPQ